jgi:hypothetical protein
MILFSSMFSGVTESSGPALGPGQFLDRADGGLIACLEYQLGNTLPASDSSFFTGSIE